MKKGIYYSVIMATLMGTFIGCTSSDATNNQKKVDEVVEAKNTTDKKGIDKSQELTELKIIQGKTAKFTEDLLAGKDISNSGFAKNPNYDARKTPMVVDSQGNIYKGGKLEYIDADNHLVQIKAVSKNEVIISIDSNDDNIFSQDEEFLAIYQAKTVVGKGPIKMTNEDRRDLSDWLMVHNESDTVEVFIGLTEIVEKVATDGTAVTTQVSQIDIDATKKKVEAFLSENSITASSVVGISMLKMTLTKSKIKVLQAKYGEDKMWMDLAEFVRVLD